MMNINFNIEYRTSWGEDVRVVISEIPENKSYILPLTTRDGIKWVGEARLKSSSCRYFYVIYSAGKEIRREFCGVERSLGISSVSDGDSNYKVYDAWKDLPKELPFYSSAFTNQFAKSKHQIKYQFNSSVILKVYFPMARKGDLLALVGSNDYLGNWDTEKALFFNSLNYPEWEIVLDAEKLKAPLEYKFILVNKDKGEIKWELNSNRFLASNDVISNMSIVLSDNYVHFDLPAKKIAGVAIPVFSLRSSTSNGIGDFEDLKKLVDWAVKVKMHVIQILPINDTTITKSWTDSYPYNSISIYAFNPMYINVFKAGKLKNKGLMETFVQKSQNLNDLAKLDYEAVLQLKLDYLRLLYKQEWKSVSQNKQYQSFFEKNSGWLKSYAAFSYLRDIYKTANFREWCKYNVYKEDEIEKLVDEKSVDFENIAYYYYIQYLLHLQLTDAVNYARSRGVVIKGDIPIGINRDSVEAWVEPYYFNMNGQAGAPPDDFSVKGQNWGFPTYRWDVMAADGYKWWRKRFVKMAEYFDAYRIDHILGFFRIWEVPLHSIEGLLGHFSPALPMTEQEIQAYGFPFDEEKHTKPYITDAELYRLFGLQTDFVKKTFLVKTEKESTYRLLEGYDTQRAIDEYVRNNNLSPMIREGMFKLINNVLFVEDSNEKGKFHPRIAVHGETVYTDLLDRDQKLAFDRLYEDFYYVRHNSFWANKAKEKLPHLILATKMLACAEDLGMIPACVPDVLNDLHILSLEIQRMPKKYGEEFANPREYPYYSVCTTSTHDTSTLRGWWLENAVQTKRYYNNFLGFWGEAPKHATSDICRLILRENLLSSSLLCIIPFQDWMSISENRRSANIDDERINIPSIPNHYWRYRMNVSIEDLIEADDLNSQIVQLIEDSNRG